MFKCLSKMFVDCTLAVSKGCLFFIQDITVDLNCNFDRGNESPVGLLYIKNLLNPTYGGMAQDHPIEKLTICSETGLPLYGLADIEPYVGEMLGIGGFSEVFKMTGKYSGLCLKINMEEVDLEVQTLLRLQHLDVPQVLGITWDRQMFIMTQHQMTLYEWVQNMNPSKGELLGVLIQLAEILRAFHLEGYCHNDVKPDNVMVDIKPDGAPKVTVIDLGLTRKIGENPLPSPMIPVSLWMELVRVDCPWYPPKTCRGEGCDPQTDAFSLAYAIDRMLSSVKIGAPFRKLLDSISKCYGDESWCSVETLLCALRMEMKSLPANKVAGGEGTPEGNEVQGKETIADNDWEVKVDSIGVLDLSMKSPHGKRDIMSQTSVEILPGDESRKEKEMRNNNDKEIKEITKELRTGDRTSREEMITLEEYDLMMRKLKREREAKIHIIESHKVQLKDDFEYHKRQMDIKDKTIHQLNSRMTHLRSDVIEREREVTSLKDRLVQKDETITKMEMEKLITEKKLKDQLVQKDETIKKIENEKISLEMKIKEQNDAQNKDKDIMEKRLEKAHKELKEERRERETLREENTALKQDQNNMEQLLEKVQEILNERKGPEKTTIEKDFERERTRKEEINNTIAELRHDPHPEDRKMRSMDYGLMRKFEMIEKKFEMMEKKFEMMERKFQEENASLRKGLDKMQTENSSLQKGLDKMQTEKEEELADLRDHIESLEKGNITLKKEMLDLQKRLVEENVKDGEEEKEEKKMKMKRKKKKKKKKKKNKEQKKYREEDSVDGPTLSLSELEEVPEGETLSLSELAALLEEKTVSLSELEEILTFFIKQIGFAMTLFKYRKIVIKMFPCVFKRFMESSISSKGLEEYGFIAQEEQNLKRRQRKKQKKEKGKAKHRKRKDQKKKAKQKMKRDKKNRKKGLPVSVESSSSEEQPDQPGWDWANQYPYGQPDPYGQHPQWWQNYGYGEAGIPGQQDPFGQPGQPGQQDPFGQPGQPGQQDPFGQLQLEQGQTGPQAQGRGSTRGRGGPGRGRGGPAQGRGGPAEGRGGPGRGRGGPDRGRGGPPGGRGDPQRGRGQPQAGRGDPQRGRGQPKAGRGQPQAGRGQPGRGRPQRGRGGPQRGRGQPERGRGGPPRGRGQPERGRGAPQRGRGGPPRGRGQPERGRGGPPRGRGG